MTKENVAIKYTTDAPLAVQANVSEGQPDACLPGELVMCAETGNDTAKIITIDANGDGVVTEGVLTNESKGSVTVSSYGEGPSSILLNANSVTATQIINDSVASEKFASPILITKGGTGQATQSTALNALLPSQANNSNKRLITDGTNTSWLRDSLSIDQLTDVDTSSATRLNSQLLKWDLSTLQWRQRETVTKFSDELPTNQQSGRLGQIALGEEYFYACQGYDKWSRTPLQPWTGDGAILRAPESNGYAYTLEPLVFGGDPYFLNVTLLLHMNGADLSTAFPDSSLNAISLSRGGNTSIRTTPSKYGNSSGYFDGSGDYLQYPSVNSGSDLIGSDFTAEAWIYPLSYNVSGKRIFAAGGGSVSWNSTNGIHWLLQLDGSGRLNFQYWNGTGAVGLSTTAAASLSTWSHVAISISGSTLYMAVNGVVQSFSVTGITRPSTAPYLSIATIYGESGGTPVAYQGYMDEVRITKGVARYTSNFTTPPGEFGELGYPRDIHFNNVSLLMHADGANGSTFFRDHSVNHFTLTPSNNARISTTRSKFGGSSLFLDGFGDYLSIPDNVAFQLGYGNSTIEFWFYAESLNVTNPVILGNGNTSFSGGEGTYAWHIMVSGSPRKLRMATNTNNPLVSSTTTIVPGTWYHVAISRTSGLTRLFVNGVFEADTGSGGNLNISNNGLFIGKNGWSGVEGHWHGYIDELRITKGVSRYTSNTTFAVPTSPYLDA